MKKILLWDSRFPKRAPERLTLPDDLASACVRSGVAGAADPAEQGALAAGAAISSALPVEIVLQHGTIPRVSRVTLPLAVAQLAVAAGIGAVPAGSTVVVAVPLNLLLTEDGAPLLGEDGISILSE